jgi:hypothetical protein
MLQTIELDIGQQMHRLLPVRSEKSTTPQQLHYF